MSLWLSDSLRTRAGLLAPVAERFLHDWLGADAPTFQGGAAGLIGLCSHMEGWLELDDVDDESERRFVEGAGALLGLLLIDHVGDARHVARGEVHRLQLGRHGFFDPFAAVDQALDAHNLRAELSRQVALAEAEARAQGPVSRVALALLDAVARERPDLRLDEHFDLSLCLRGQKKDQRIEVDLRRAVETTRDQGPDAVVAVTQRLLSMLPGAPAGSAVGGGTFGEIQDRLVPRLARADVLRELEDHPQRRLFTAQLTDELVIALMVEYDGRARYVREREVESWGLTSDEAIAVALENLAARSQHTRISATETVAGPLLVARTGDGRDSARVLLSSLYGALSARLGDDVYVGIPHRDTFFACSAKNRPLVEELKRRTAEDAARAPHKLSTRLFQLTARGVCE